MHKNEGLVFHGTARAVWLINSLLYVKNENIPKKLHREFSNNFLKYYFQEISPKTFSQGFLLIFKFSENCPKVPRISVIIIVHQFYQKYFPEFTIFRSFPRMLIQFWSMCVFSFVWQLNPSSCPMISQSNCQKAGQNE